jgi:elongation factor 2
MMPKFEQIAEILKLMHNKERIRNIGIVAHIDHGKTTMTDSLLAEAGLLSPQVAGSARALDYLEEEQKRGITIKTANISLLHETNGQPYVINLIDTPGHVDFTGKVTRALRAVDGVVVVVDAVEEIMAQTETVIRQALEERVRPVLFINKIDRLINELRLSSEEIQDKFTRIIDSFNSLIEIHGEPEFSKRWKVKPAKDTVAFGSALHRWGFTVSMTQQKGIGFADIIDAYAKSKHEGLWKLLPLHNAILDMTVKNCPSPAEAQEYRVPRIWKGRLNSETGRAMLKCDENGPTVILITNTRIDPKAGLVATGRLFSGSVEEGDQVYLIGAKKEYSVKQVSIYMSAFRESVNQVPAGNIAALTGLELARAGETLVDSQHRGVMVAFESIRYVSESVMTIAIEPKNPEDLPHLSEAMNQLAIEDPNLAVTINEKTGEYLLSGMGELHLETAIKSLRDYSGGKDITTSNPTVDYRETITAKGLAVMARSPNKQNGLWVQVEPLEDEEFVRLAKGQAENVWAINEHGNVLIDSTKNARHLDEVKDMIIQGFHWACKTGPMCEHPLRGVKVKLLDARIKEDSALRELTQIMRATSKAILGSFLTAEPVLLEPVYRIDVSTSTRWFGTITNIIAARRGKVRTTQNRGTLTIITGSVPVIETLGLSTEIRSATSGHAFWQSTFDHWGKVPENLATNIIKQNRIKRGLPPEIPKPNKFIDET